jgi:muconolactone D-isomerase
MIFHVRMTVAIPRDVDAQELERLNAAEHEYARALQLDGRWLHLWRVAGSFENISVFDVNDADELHELLSALPLYPFMQITVTALSHHPGAIH